LGDNFVCAHAGEEIRRIANTRFFIGFSRRTSPLRSIEPDRPKEVHKGYLLKRKRFALFVC
jgi:hypothetical protein